MTSAFTRLTLKFMEVHFTPEWEAKLNEMATVTGRPADYLLQDAMAGYFEELTQARGAGSVGTNRCQLPCT